MSTASIIQCFDATLDWRLIIEQSWCSAHFLDEVETIYDRLINNPYQFPDSPDEYLFLRGYCEALFKTMHYKVIYRIENQQVLIVGVFHTLEDYRRKV